MNGPLDISHPYEALTPDWVINAVESTGRLSDARILPLNSYENRVYQVGIEEGEPVIAKFYRPRRWTDEQILEEHQLTRELYDLDIPVVPPIEDDDGGTLYEYQDFRFALYCRRGGHPPELDNLDHLLVLGRYMGRIHAVSGKHCFQYRPAISAESFAAGSFDYLLTHNFIPMDLRDAYESLGQHILERLNRVFEEYKDIPAIRLHGDCHPGNILWRDDKPHFVDFDDARNGPAIQDLWMLLSGERHYRQLQLSEVIEGYSEFCDFNPRELGLVEALRTMRIMHHSAWLARRWDDPAFPRNFPWFNTERYWAEHILELREQLAALDEEPLRLL